MGNIWSYFFPPRDTPGLQQRRYFVSSQLTEVRSEVSSKDKNKAQSQNAAMDQRCRLALQKSHNDLIRDLYVKRTVDNLYAALVLTLEQKQIIEGMSTDHDRRSALLHIIATGGQRAYDQLCQTLSNDQHWLKDILDKNYETITEDELAKMERKQGHPQQTELSDCLKRNMQDKLNEWKTALEEGVLNQIEGVSYRGELLPYIKQPCLVQTNAPGLKSFLDTIEVVKKSHPGDRLVIYGEAGMGKTTLLKQLTRLWIDGGDSELANKFVYVFFIPLRRVGQNTLPNIICDELGLLPERCLEKLKDSLEMEQHRVLFLLDSFEELRGDVVRARRTDIDDLITGKLYPKSTVVVTSRPRSKLKEAGDQTTAQLGDLPENEVKAVIEQQFGEDEYAIDKVQRSFPAMAYLQKPINLALFIFIITQNKHLTLSYTQAELFSLVLHYIMLAFAKKKKLEEFIPQPSSYIANKAIPKDIRRLFRDIAKKCYEEKEGNDVILHIEDSEDLKEYLDFGLFTAGTDTNTVLLPHRLFIEYFVAAHIAENPEALAALFGEIKEESESESPSPSLPDIVRPMGLENILRFVIALSPQPQLGQVCLQVGSFFALERMKIDDDCDNYGLVNLEYYTELIRDCSDESGKRLLVTALLDAPVRDVTDADKEEDRLHVLLPSLNHKQLVTFLKKTHNLDLYVNDGMLTLSCAGKNRRIGIRDENKKTVESLVFHHDCVIEADELDITGENDLTLPASMLKRMSGVRQLSIYYCRLVRGIPKLGPQQSLPAPTIKSSLERVVLFEVEGLERCDVITPYRCQLEIERCGNIRASTLKTCFPKVSELELCRTIVVHLSEEELTSWLSTVQTMTELKLVPQLEGTPLSLCCLLTILGKKGLETLVLHKYTLLLDARHTSGSFTQHSTLSRLDLHDCKGNVDLDQLFEVCSRQCPQLMALWVWYSNLVFDDKVESVRQLPRLQDFTMRSSSVRTQAGRILSKKDVKQLLHRLCPSAGIDV